MATSETGPKIKFHKKLHGRNVQLQQDDTVAERVKGMNDTIVFTDRPIALNEKVSVRINAIDPNTAVGLGYAITNYDLATWDGPFPKYWNEFETIPAGEVWKKFLNSKDASIESVVDFLVNEEGEVVLGINGETEVVLTGIDTKLPLTLGLDLGWGATVLELI